MPLDTRDDEGEAVRLLQAGDGVVDRPEERLVSLVPHGRRADPEATGEAGAPSWARVDQGEGLRDVLVEDVRDRVVEPRGLLVEDEHAVAGGSVQREDEVARGERLVDHGPRPDPEGKSDRRGVAARREESDTSERVVPVHLPQE